jgi:hypothetical protein
MTNPRYFYILYMHDIRYTHGADVTPVCWSYSKDEIRQLLDSERVDEYHDGRAKSFRKGGPLEWFSLPSLENPIQHFQDPRGSLPTASAVFQIGRHARGAKP